MPSPFPGGLNYGTDFVTSQAFRAAHGGIPHSAGHLPQTLLGTRLTVAENVNIPGMSVLADIPAKQICFWKVHRGSPPVNQPNHLWWYVSVELMPGFSGRIFTSKNVRDVCPLSRPLAFSSSCRESVRVSRGRPQIRRLGTKNETTGGTILSRRGAGLNSSQLTWHQPNSDRIPGPEC